MTSSWGRPDQERGRFLRTRRERLRPADVGLVEESGRRTRGLRREEVAGLAHISTAWYTHLEQGRPFRPSSEVLDALVRALRLDDAERRYLYGLSDPAALPDPHLRDPDAAAVAAALVAHTDGSPYPVYALDVHGDVVAANPAVADWYGDVGTEARPNLIRWLVTSPDARRHLHDWAADLHHVTAQIRFHVGVAGPDPRTRALVEELLDASPEFRRSWETHDVAAASTHHRTFDHDERGTVTLRLVVVRPTADPATVVSFHVPVPPRTW